ncbi:MAG TPA: glycosyltransferase family 4 protein [Acidimicrobiales bacterium]
MKLGLIVPRYGTEVVGGTEHWLRTLCEHLVALRAWEVEVFTTCAISAATWADEYPPGDACLNDVTVHRHASRSGRNPAYLELYDTIRLDPEAVPDRVARRFVELVGPVCPDVIGQAADSDCDLVAVTPYLFWPAVHGVPRLGRRVIFHGAAHDEPELHLPLMGGVFGAVGGFSYNSFAERDLVQRTFQVAHLPSSVVGNAVVEGTGDPAAARAALGLSSDERFVLCLGRVERAKGAHLLAELWGLYRRRRPTAPRLVFLGPVHDELEVPRGVVVAGRQSEEVKWGALAGCEFLISPSAWESFSLVVVEGWLANKAVLVNGRCEPTVEHCQRSCGGMWFDQYGDFEVAVDTLLADGALRDRLAANGAVYARRHFSWPAITERYAELADRVVTAWAGASGG